MQKDHGSNLIDAIRKGVNVPGAMSNVVRSVVCGVGGKGDRESV
jgi:hypothetical protein